MKEFELYFNLIESFNNRSVSFGHQKCLFQREFNFSDFHKILKKVPGIKNIRLSRFGEEVPKSKFTSNGDQINTNAVLEEFSQSATIILENLQLYSEYFDNIKRNFFELYKCDLNINMYVTPPHSVGFGQHYDPHDVLIFHLFGQKNWKTWKTSKIDPIKEESYFKLSKVEQLGLQNEKFTERILQKGDFLYLPKGTLHDTETVENYSIHITIGITPTYNFDIYKKQFLKKHPKARKFLDLEIDLIKCHTPKDQAVLKNIFEKKEFKLSTTDLFIFKKLELKNQSTDVKWNSKFIKDINSLTTNLDYSDFKLELNSEYIREIKKISKKIIIQTSRYDLELPSTVELVIKRLRKNKRFKDVFKGFDQYSSKIILISLINHRIVSIG